MKYLLRTALGASLAVALVAASTAAFAQTQTTKAPNDSQVQLDGLESRVIDQVWANTDSYFHNGDFNRCVAMCRICVQSDPDFDEACSSAAWLLWSMGDKPAANALMADVVKRAKNKWQAQYTYAEQLMVRREYKDALPHLQAASAAPYAPVIVWKQLGHAYEHTDDLKKSLATWEYIVEKFPKEPAGPPNLARLKAKVDGTYVPRTPGNKTT